MEEIHIQSYFIEAKDECEAIEIIEKEKQSDKCFYEKGQCEYKDLTNSGYDETKVILDIPKSWQIIFEDNRLFKNPPSDIRNLYYELCINEAKKKSKDIITKITVSVGLMSFYDILCNLFYYYGKSDFEKVMKKIYDEKNV